MKLMQKALLAALLFATLTGCAPRSGNHGDLVQIPALTRPPPPPPSLLPLVHSEPGPPRVGRPSRAEGAAIDVEWHGQYYPATVLGPAKDGKVRIHYDGYGDDWDEDVGDDRIRERNQVDEPGL